MFDLTDEETAAVAVVEKLRMDANRMFGDGAVAARRQLAEAEKAQPYQLAKLKDGLRDFLHLDVVQTYLPLVQEAVTAPEVGEILAVLQTTLTTIGERANSEEWHKVRATWTARRYWALRAANLPEAVAAQIVVAESARQFPAGALLPALQNFAKK